MRVELSGWQRDGYTDTRVLTCFFILFDRGHPQGLAAIKPEGLDAIFPEGGVVFRVIHDVSNDSMALLEQTCTQKHTNHAGINAVKSIYLNLSQS